jgi:hypothetical protein
MTDPAQLSYEQALPQLKNVYLEDSYVLHITTSTGSVAFELDLVLTPGHPRYHEPPPGDQYCYRRGEVAIECAKSVRWVRRSTHEFRDATGEVDYGSIDAWNLDGDVSHILGDWGELAVDGGDVRLTLEPEDEQRTGEESASR